MKKMIPILVGAAALSMGARAVQAHVSIGVGIGIPGPVYAAPVYSPPPVVYAPPAPPVVYAPPPTVVVGGYGGYYRPWHPYYPRYGGYYRGW